MDIDLKFKGLKLTRLKRLCDNHEHPRRVILQAYLKLPNSQVHFHRNFCIDLTTFNKIEGAPKFYVKHLKIWESFLENSSEDSLVLLSVSLWLNEFIKIENKFAFN